MVSDAILHYRTGKPIKTIVVYSARNLFIMHSKKPLKIRAAFDVLFLCNTTRKT